MHKLAVFVSLLVCAIAAAQSPKPNFSGKWVLDPSRSDLGGSAEGITRIDMIDHQEPRLVQNITTSTAQGNTAITFVYTTDGKAGVTKVAKSQVRWTARWQGNQLVVVQSAPLKKGSAESKEIWQLSPDSKTLTVDRVMKAEGKSAHHKLVFTKQ